MKQYDPIRKKLLDYTVEVDKNKLWEQTSFAIPQKRKRRALPFILLAGIILFGAGYMYRSSGTIHDPAVLTSENLTTTQPLTSTQHSPILPKTVQINPDKNNQVQLNSSSSNVSVKHQASSSLRIEYKESGSSGSVIQHNSPNSTHSTSNLPKENRQEIEFVANNMSVLNNQPLPATINKEEIKLTETSLEEIIPQLNAEDNLKGEINSGSRVIGLLMSIDDLPIHSVAYSLEKNSAFSGGINSIQPAKHKNNIAISVMQGIGFSKMHLLTSNPELKPYQEKWKTNLRSLEMFSTSLQASIPIGHRIQLGAGFQYSQLTSQLDYTRSTTERITGEGLTSIIIDENGQQQSVTGTVGITRETQIHSTRFTYHRRVDLESIVAINLYSKKGIHINAWMKGGINLFYAAEGSTFDINNAITKFSASDNPFSLSSPFTYGGGLESELRLNRHWILKSKIAYEQFTYDHKRFAKKLQSRHDVFSLALGVGYIL